MASGTAGTQRCAWQAEQVAKPVSGLVSDLVRAMLRRANEYAWYEGRPNPPQRFTVEDLIEELQG